jgi:putative CRISPR-associated protein (TIGR02620 family)
MSKLVVTRHPALVDYLRERGTIPTSPDDVQVLSHADPIDVAGRDVIGVLPLHLAASAKTITEVPLSLPPELRGHEITIDQVREYAGSPTTYVVEQV